MQKKICIFAAHFYPHLGGIERYSHQLSLKLLEQGYQVDIVTSNTENCADEEIIDGIKVYRLPVIKFMNGRLPIPLLNIKFIKMFRTIANIKSDYYIINARFYFHSLIGAILAKFKKKPALLIEHGTGHFTVGNRFFDFIGHFYEHLLTFFIKIFITKFYGVSYACNKWLEHFKIRASGVFYNGIDTSYVIKKPCDLREKYNIPDDSIIISYIGRLIPEKGILTLLDSFSNLNNEETYLFVAGNGPLYNQLVEKTSNDKNIFMLGKLEYDEVMNLLKNTDIFVLPTNFPEGLPTSILEAGINHCAVIATPKGGTPEIINDKSLGFIIPPESKEDITYSINKLLNDKKLMHELAHNLYEKVKSELDWTIIAKHVSNTLKITKK